MKLGTGLCAVEGDGRDHRISQPNLRCKSGRGQSQVGLVYGCDGYALCAFICKKRQERKGKGIFSLRYVQRMEVSEFTGRTGGKAEISPPFTEDCLGRLTHWGFLRCLATGLMLSNVCIVDGQHGPAQLELIVQENSEGLQLTEASAQGL